MDHSKDQVTEAFKLFDSDADNHLLVSEAICAIRALGHILTDSDMKSLLQRVGVDSGRGGRVDLAKFKQMHASLPRQDYTKQLQDAFRTVDKDGGGFVMATELKHLLTNMGDRLSEEDFKILLQELDIDTEGRVQFNEFIRLLNANR